MVDIMDRRMTRSLSNEMQARAAMPSSSFGGYHRNVHEPAYGYSQHGQQNGIHSHVSVQNFAHGQGQQSLGGGSHLYNLDLSFQHHPFQSSNVNGEMMTIQGGGSTYHRNTSEEIFLSNLMNSSLVPGTPTMEAAASLGFMETMSPHPHPHQHSPLAHRGNSEELFNNWITTDTSSHETSNHNQTGMPPSPGSRPRQNSRRMSSELQAIIAQQHSWAPRAEEPIYMQTNAYHSDDFNSNNSGDQKHRGNVLKDKGDQNGNNAYKNIWLNSTSPMTRSRSSELRRRYAQYEGLPFPPPPEALQKLASNGNLDVLGNPTLSSLGSMARDIGTGGTSQNERDPKHVVSQHPLAPSGLSVAQQAESDHITETAHTGEQHGRSVSDVVGLLKGSLERKKLQAKQQNQQQQQQQSQQHQGMRNLQASSSQPQGVNRQEELLSRPQDQRQQSHGEEGSHPFTSMQQPNVLSRQQSNVASMQQHNGPSIQQSNVPPKQQSSVPQMQQHNLMHAQSPSESTAAAPSHSAGMATSDGPANSGVSSVHKQALKRGSGAVDSPQGQAFSGFDSPSAHSAGDAYDNGTSKGDMSKKPGHLTRAGSVTSSLRPGFQVSEIDGATKKRRVERQRKMAEAKGRVNAPPLPADLQAVIKRCEALEKEVRSLKLNLSFMNRKDSEQTKRIEELEQQNEDLKEELESANK